MALSKTGRFLSKAEILGVGVFSPFQIWGVFVNSPCFWGRAKGAAKGSCGETVVQKGVFGESVSSLLP